MTRVSLPATAWWHATLAGWLEATRRPLTRQTKARGERQGAGRGNAREQRAVPSPLGLQSSRRSDGRRSGSSGSCRPKPTAATAGLARQVPSEARVEPATPGPPRDRERQKLAGTVRLLQPMGAGGRRPPVDHPA